MSFSNLQVRCEPRRLFFSPVEYVSVRSGFRTLRGTAINISSSGLCMFSDDPLGEGEEITVTSALPTGQRTFTVRWSSSSSRTSLWWD